MEPTWSQDGLKCLKMEPRCSKMESKCPKMEPRCLKMEPRCPKVEVSRCLLASLWGLIFDDSCTKTLHLSSHGPKWGQDAPRWSQDTPRWSQDAPKWSPDGPKMEPRCSNLLLFGAYLSSHCTLLVCACLGLCALCVSCVFSHFDAPLTHILIVASVC